jgi:hypothetical protein
MLLLPSILGIQVQSAILRHLPNLDYRVRRFYKEIDGGHIVASREMVWFVPGEEDYIWELDRIQYKDIVVERVKLKYFIDENHGYNDHEEAVMMLLLALS